MSRCSSAIGAGLAALALGGCVLDASLGVLDGDSGGADGVSDPTGDGLGGAGPVEGEPDSSSGRELETGTGGTEGLSASGSGLEPESDAGTASPTGSGPPDDDGDGAADDADDADDAEGLDEAPFGMRPTHHSHIVDCEESQPSAWRAKGPRLDRLWIGGVYQTHGDHHGNHHPVGHGTVVWGKSGSNVLVLGSYEPVDWSITVLPNARLERVILTGYYPQTVQAPDDVEVEIHTYANGAKTWATGYVLSDPDPMSDGGGESLVEFAMARTGRLPYAFDGCYDASRFVYREPDV